MSTLHSQEQSQPAGFFDRSRQWLGGKSIWDGLDLLAKLLVPLILGVATLLFSLQQANLAQQQRAQDQASTVDQQRQATFVKYQDDMRDLLLNKGLLTSKQDDEIRAIAFTETLSAMRQLDAKRNSFLLQFLKDARLNGADPNTGSLYNTPNIIDFHGVVLRDIDLRDADFSYADFSGADLSDAVLTDAVLSDAVLTDGVDLSGADLSGARNLTQQQLDRVYSCKGATLPQGLTCHNNP